MSLGQLVVELSLDGNEFTVNLKKADGQLARFVQNTERADSSIKAAERSTRSWGNVLRDSVIVLSLIRSAIQNVGDAMFGWQRSIVAVNADLQRSIALMKSFSTAGTEAAKTQEAIADVRMLMNKAAASPFDMAAITDSFVKLRVAGIENTKGSLDTLVDSVAAFGGTSENLKRASVAIQQMAGKGVVSMEELRQQLGESVPTAIQAMADGLGTSYDKLVKQISLGRVKAEPAIKAMMDELDRSFKGRAEDMMDSWTGAVAQFQTSMKGLAAAFGGLEQTGYAENGYMKTLVTELRNLSDIFNSPEMVDTAKQLGLAMASIAKSAADGVKTIIEYREEIYQVGKALVTVYAIMKGASLIGGAMSGIGLFVSSIKNMRSEAGLSVGVLGNLKAAMESQSAATARQAAAGANGAAAMGRWGHAASALTGALGILGGPIGIVAGLAISGGIAWYNYKQEVEATRQAVLDLNGALTNSDQLEVLDQEIRQYELKMQMLTDRMNNRKKSIYAGSIFGFFDEDRTAEDKANVDKQGAQLQKLLGDRFKGVQAVAEREAGQLLIVEERAIRSAYSKISATYNTEKNKLLDQRRQDQIGEEDYHKQLAQIRQKDTENSISMLEQKLSDVRAQEKALEQTVIQSGERVNKDVLAKHIANKSLITYLEGELVTQKENLIATNRTLESTLIGGGSGSGSGGKDVKFNPLVKYMDSLAISVAKAGAKAKEENPHLAQLYQTVENMQLQGMKADPAMIERARQLASERWKLEKEAKALKDAAQGYEDSMSRMGQIDKVIGGKLNKVENENPWMKASADAERYRDEISSLRESLNSYLATAQELGDADLVSDIEKSGEALAKVNAKIDELSVQDTAKRMKQQTTEINESLMSQSQQVQAQYARQIEWARAYYQENKSLLEGDAEAREAYQSYIAALEDKHRRDTESGLDAWIRANMDASEKYKSLWQSAMDGFVDTVVDGLVEGKFEVADFVQYVLKELLKVQMAKAVAGIATAIGNAYAGGGGAAASAGSTAAGYSGSDFSAWSSAQNYANGGIMTPWGNAKLKQYANGGVARSPQVAVFGEGSMAEAYVPLPDGRTIPVTLQGAGGASSGQSETKTPQVSVNVINQSGTQMNAEQTGQGFDGEQFVVDVVLKAVNRPGPVRDAVRGAK